MRSCRGGVHRTRTRTRQFSIDVRASIQVRASPNKNATHVRRCRRRRRRRRCRCCRCSATASRFSSELPTRESRESSCISNERVKERKLGYFLFPPSGREWSTIFFLSLSLSLFYSLSPVHTFYELIGSPWILSDAPQCLSRLIKYAGIIYSPFCLSPFSLVRLQCLYFFSFFRFRPQFSRTLIDGARVHLKF